MSQLCIEKNATCVYNLSDYTLSEPEMSLLNKGLKFCPTPPKPDSGILIRDIESFFRSSSIKLHFSNLAEKDKTATLPDTGPVCTILIYAPKTAFHHPALKPKSRWNAPGPPPP